MRPGDRLTSVGDVQVLDSFDELRAELKRTAAGERIGLRWYRGSNRVMRVRPPLLTLPAEEMPGSLVRYESVSLDGIRQRLILSEPIDSRRSPGLVFYLSGLGCALLTTTGSRPVARSSSCWMAGRQRALPRRVWRSAVKATARARTAPRSASRTKEEATLPPSSIWRSVAFAVASSCSATVSAGSLPRWW